MKIKHIHCEDLEFRFKHGEYKMSHVTQTRIRPRLIRLETDDGCVGWGEIIRRGRYDDEAPPLEDEILADLVGNPVSNITALLPELRERGPALRGFAFGLDTAWLDWMAHKAGVPLYAMLGGQLTTAVPDYYSLSGGVDSVQAAAELSTEAAGWPVVQIKLGVGSLDDDLALVEATLEALDAGQVILADFNGALDVESALRVITEFDDRRLIWEEVCNTVDENNEVAARCDQPVMFDQCLAELADITRVAAAGVAHSVAIKPAFLGGLQIARSARDTCIEAGMKVRIDGPWCGHIATTANLHLACGAPAAQLIAGCDLRQPLIIDQDWGGTRHLSGHRIAPFDDPGHGVIPPQGPEPETFTG